MYVLYIFTRKKINKNGSSMEFPKKEGFENGTIYFLWCMILSKFGLIPRLDGLTKISSKQIFEKNKTNILKVGTHP